jgi:arylsulfatase A-like enzyme
MLKMRASFYSQRCSSPTRATIQTGRHVLRYGLQNTVIWPQDAWAVPKNETFISQNMHDAGYATAAVSLSPY